MAERHAAAPHAAVRGGDAGGLAAGDASRATDTSVATVTTSLAAVELCDEDVAMRCSLLKAMLALLPTLSGRQCWRSC